LCEGWFQVKIFWFQVSGFASRSLREGWFQVSGFASRSLCEGWFQIIIFKLPTIDNL